MSKFWGTMLALPRVLGCAFLLFGFALSGCGDGTNVAGTFDASPEAADASTPADEFDHFGFVVSPTVPLQDQLFEVVVTAYSSSDDSQRMSGYDGLVTMSASVGNLSAGASGQEINNGKLTFSVSLDASGTDVVLTVSDDQFTTIRGSSSPLYISPPGDTAAARDVVISEVNWFGNDLASTDEWIEIRNVSGGELNLSEWTLEGAGTSTSPIVQFDNGTSLADGAYLLLARRQGADVDGERSALTGLSGVQIHTMELGNAGEALFLRDVAGSTIDQTPSGAWPAGDNANDLSMERRDELAGGYTDGALADAWYTWSSLDTVQTSNLATSGRGTPGTTNSNPDLFDHFGFDIQPTTPKANFEFTVTITAYTSTDDTEIVTGYNGLVTLSAQTGGLTGQVSNQPMSGGVATLTVRSDTQGPGQAITVNDSIYADIVGTSPVFEVLPEGDPALLRQVVISEVNYFGNSLADADEWIELRNVSGETLNLAGWTIEAAGTGAAAITIASATFLADGEYLVLADRQGPDVDTMRTSVTGVAGVQIAPLSLANGGEHLVLRDVESTLIDETPDLGWPAGSNAVDYSMERRDELHGGYSDGALDGAWYTWSSIDGVSSTSLDTSDFGTPGTSNSDPDLFDHFTFTITPANPIVGQDFIVDVQAFASTDESTPLTAYNGTVSVSEAVAGSLTGQVISQPIAAGAASMTLQFDRVASALALTVRDDIYPELSGVSANIVITDTGDDAQPLDVVINEVNWFGNDVSSSDEWIELRNVSGASLDISGWSIDGLGAGSDALIVDSDTILADGAYLIIGDRQGADVDGDRTSLTGVVGVQVNSTVALNNGGDPLTLRDIDGTVIDQTPTGTWPAGDSTSDRSMERRDDVSGGGYTDGTLAGAWYTWNPEANTDTTNADSGDSGTPGADNSDPDAVRLPVPLPYATGFEVGEPAFENRLSGGFINVPPPGTSAQNGIAIAATDSLTLEFGGRQLQSLDCLVLNNDTNPVEAAAFAMASTLNGGNVLTGRIKLLWFTDSVCTVAHATADAPGTSAALLDGAYSEFTISTAPPAGATHLKIRFEIQDAIAGADPEDDYAVDDVTVAQQQP